MFAERLSINPEAFCIRRRHVHFGYAIAGHLDIEMQFATLFALGASHLAAYALVSALARR